MEQGSSSKKHSRKSISLQTKIKVLDRLAKGQSYAFVGRKFNLSDSTVRTIKRKEESIRAAVTRGTSVSTKSASYARNPLLEKMEKALMIWIEDNTKKHIALDNNIIREKALHLYNLLQMQEPSTSTPKKKQEFTASSGWFYLFAKRQGLRNVHIKGESASADTESAAAFPAVLKSIVEEGGYVADQVYNADETGLYWKRMPSRTYISQAEKCASGFKAAKDRVSLLFCSNASGDCLMKPLFINRSLRPRSMKNENFSTLPVYWMANTKAWMTKELFSRWFKECFVPDAKRYLEEKGLDFKVLLLLDNAPGHLEIAHPNVKIIFLPANTTSIIQPLDQGIIATFKRY